MHRLATVHARDNQPTNQPTTNDVTTQPISISASFTNVKEALNNTPSGIYLPRVKKNNNDNNNSNAGWWGSQGSCWHAAWPQPLCSTSVHISVAVQPKLMHWACIALSASKRQASRPDNTLSAAGIPISKKSAGLCCTNGAWAPWQHVSHSMAGRQAGCLGRYGHLYDCTVIFGLIPQGSRCSRNGGVTQVGQIQQPGSSTHFLFNSGRVPWPTLWGRSRVVTWDVCQSFQATSVKFSFCINGFQLSWLYAHVTAPYKFSYYYYYYYYYYLTLCCLLHDSFLVDEQPE